MEERSSYLLPRGLAILGLVFAAIELALAFRGSHPSASGGKNETTGLPVLASIAFTAAYFYVIPFLGFVLATALAIIAFAWLMGYRRRKLVAALAVTVPALLHLAFVELLQAPLPSGFAGALPF